MIDGERHNEDGASAPVGYDAWDRTPRGVWIGDSEFGLARSLLQPEPGVYRLMLRAFVVAAGNGG